MRIFFIHIITSLERKWHVGSHIPCIINLRQHIKLRSCCIKFHFKSGISEQLFIEFKLQDTQIRHDDNICVRFCDFEVTAQPSVNVDHVTAQQLIDFRDIHLIKSNIQCIPGGNGQIAIYFQVLVAREKGEIRYFDRGCINLDHVCRVDSPVFFI